MGAGAGRAADAREATRRASARERRSLLALRRGIRMQAFTSWLEGALARRAEIVVATDLDGTLAPLAADSEPSRPSDRAIAVLNRLAATPGVRVLVLSDRAIEDAADRLRDLRRVAIGAEHGSVVLEASGHLASEEPPVARQPLSDLILRVASIVTNIEGASIDVKRGSVALDLRRVSETIAPSLVARFRDAARSLDARVLETRGVAEASFRRGDKGTALRAWLGGRAATAAVLYAGDDASDEGAFAALRSLPHGLGLHVESEARIDRPTLAHDVLPGPRAWIDLLAHLAELLGVRASVTH